MKKTIATTVAIAMLLALVPGVMAADTTDQVTVHGESYDSIQAAIDAAPETTVTKEQLWTRTEDTLGELEGELKVHVTSEEDKTVFEAWSPSDYAKNDLLTFAFDFDADGEADAQFQWNAKGDKDWNMKTASDGSWSGTWEEVPEDYKVSKDGHHYKLEVPNSKLNEGKKEDYKFGVDADGQPSGNGQTFYPVPWNLWSTRDNPNDVTNSANYKKMKVGQELPATVKVAGGTYEESVSITKEGLKLVSTGSREETVIDAEGAGPTVRINAPNVKVSGFTIKGAEGDGKQGQGLVLSSPNGAEQTNADNAVLRA